MTFILNIKKLEVYIQKSVLHNSYSIDNVGIIRSKILIFFCSGWDLNPKPYIFYTLFILTELSSREPKILI